MILQPENYRAVPAWYGRNRWLGDVADYLRTHAGEQLRAQHKVAVDTLLRVARAEAATAAATSGRDVATSHETLAYRLGISPATVKRARRFLRAAGFAVVVVTGGWLTRKQRELAGAVVVEGRGWRGQIKAASTRALTHPPGLWRTRPTRTRVPAGRRRDPLSQRDQLPLSDTPRRGVSTRVRARAVDESGSGDDRDKPKPLWIQRLAAGLQARMPWLARYQHIGNVIRVLEQAHVPEGATVTRILDGIEAGNRAAGGRRVLDVDTQRDKIAYLKWLMAGIPADWPLAPRPRPRGCEHWDRFGHGVCVRCGDVLTRVHAAHPDLPHDLGQAG